MNTLSRYLQGAGFLTAQAVVQRLIGMFTSIILARGLGAASFGAYSAVVNTANTAYGMVRLGVDAAILVYTARGTEDVEARRVTGELFGAGFSILATAGFFAAAVTAVSAEWLALAVFGQPELVGPLKFAGVLTALQCLAQFSYAVLAGFQKFGVYARLMILNAVVVLTLSAGGMWFYGLAGVLGGYGVAQGILTVSLGCAASRAMREQGIQVAYSRLGRAVGSLMRLGLPFYASGLVAVPVIFYLQGLLSRSFIPASVAAATTSTLTHARADAGAPASRVFDYAFLHLKVVWYLTTIVAITLVVLTPILVETLFGIEYATAIEPGMVALFSTVLSSTTAAAGSLFFAMERSSIIFWQSVLQSLVLAFVGLLVIPVMGVLGYVGAELAGNLIGLAFILVVAVRMSDCDWRNGRHTQAFVLCTLAGFVSVLIILGVFAASARILPLALITVLLTLGMLRYGLSVWEQSVISRLTLRLPASNG